MKKIFLLIILLTFLFSCDRKEENRVSNSGNKVSRASQRGKSAKSEHQHSTNCPYCSHFKENLSTNSTTESADDKKVEQNVNKFSDKFKLDSLTPEEQEEYIKNVMSTSTFQNAVRHCRDLRWTSIKLAIKLAEYLLEDSKNDVEKAMAISLLGTLTVNKLGLSVRDNSEYNDVINLLENNMTLIKEQFAEHNELLFSMQNVVWSLSSIYICREHNMNKALELSENYFETLKDYKENNKKSAEQSIIITTYQGIFNSLKFAQQHNKFKSIKLNENNLEHLIDFAEKMTKEDWPYGLEYEKRQFSEYKKETLDILNLYKKETYGK